MGTVRDLAICDLTSGTTSVVNHLTYNAFGQVLSQTNPATGNAAAVDCLFGFTGRPFDRTRDCRTTSIDGMTPAFGRGSAKIRRGLRRGIRICIGTWATARRMRPTRGAKIDGLFITEPTGGWLLRFGIRPEPA